MQGATESAPRSVGEGDGRNDGVRRRGCAEEPAAQHEEARLQSLAESSAARPGAANLRTALHGQERGFSRSKAESILKHLIQEAGLPHPDTNRELAGKERDAVWSRQRLIVEIDGYAAHGTRRAFEGDRRRGAELQAAGWRTMRITWRQLCDEPIAVAGRVGRALYSAAP